MPDPEPRDPEWTVDDAAAYFTESGIPVTGAQLAGIITLLPAFHPCGRAPSGPQGGLGKNLYRMSELMKLHSRLAEWLVP